MKKPILAILLTGSLLAVAGEISKIHDKTASNKAEGADSSKDPEEVEFTDHGITEIGIERTKCNGECPSYTFIVKADGTFRYKGKKHVERKGKFTGTIPDWHFHKLAQFIKDSDYMKLSSDYSIAITHPPTTYTMVVMNGTRKTIRNYASAGPSKLWAIEQLIDQLLDKATWNEPKPSSDKKK